MLPERARQICIDAISKAVYQVAKENLDSVQNTIKSPITETLQTKVKTSSSEIFETVTQGQQKVCFQLNLSNKSTVNGLKMLDLQLAACTLDNINSRFSFQKRFNISSMLALREKKCCLSLRYI